MSRASCRAVAKTATAPPLWRAVRRNEAPRAVLERCSEVAAILSTPAIRLAPRPLRRFFNGLPPEIGVRGHKRSHETKWSSREGGEVRADLRQDDLRGIRPHPVDAGQIDASESPELVRAGCSPRPLMAFSLAGLG